MFKKMLAFMLSMTTLASASPFVELKKITAEGETSELSNVQNDYEIKASNSIGNYINEQMQKHQSSEDNSLTIPTMTPIVKSTEVYSVTGLTFYTENGTVVIETSQSKPCIAKIRFMDEDSQKCLIETTIPVKTGELLINQTTVNTSDLSEYYTIECVLVDDFGKELCSPFVQDRQTKEMQEIIATDIYDFPEDKVICFSQSDNNDFIVLSDETIIAETTDDNNTLVSADYEKNVFIFENANESITDLKNGDYFYSQPNESDIIAVTVKNVSEDGDRVIIKGSDENFEEMVTFMKFESKSDASELMIDSSTADEDIVFEEEKLNNRDEGFQPVTDTNVELSFSKAVEIITEEVVNEPQKQKEQIIEETEVTETETTTHQTETSTEATTSSGTETIVEETTATIIETQEIPVTAEDEISFEPVTQNYVDIMVDDAYDSEEDENKINEIKGEEAIEFEIPLYDGKSEHGGAEEGAEASFTLQIGFRHEVNFYRNFTKTRIDFTLEPFVELEASTSIGVEAGISSKSVKFLSDINTPLGKIRIATAIPGFAIETELALETKLEASFKITVEISRTISFSYDNDKGLHDYSDDDCGLFNMEGSINGTVDIGLKLTPKCTFLSKKIASIGVELCLGFQISATLNITHLNKQYDKNIMLMDSIEKSEHCCTDCIKAEAKAYFSATLEMNVFSWKITSNLMEKELPLTLPPIYISISPELHMGFGECPNVAYRTSFMVVDSETQEEVSLPYNSKILVDGNETDGNYSIYCKNGTYPYSVIVNGEEVYSGKFTVKDSSKVIKIFLIYKNDSGEDDSIEFKSGSVSNIPVTTVAPVTRLKQTKSKTLQTISKSTEITCIAAGCLGEPDKNGNYTDKITYMLYGDGYMYIIGSGKMGNFSSSPFGNNASKVKKVIIENLDEKDNLVITNIGNNVFKNCSNLEYVYMPKTIESIGNNAFYDCSSLTAFRYDGENDKTTDMILPEKLTYLGSYAFAGCSTFKTITIPKTIKIVNKGLFAYCSNLQTAIIPEGIEHIKENVFEDCISLESLTLPYAGYSLDSVNTEDSECSLSRLFRTGYISSANQYCAYGSCCVPNSLKTITITGGSRIPSHAFYGFKSLKEVKLSDEITVLGNSSFRNCSSLSNIDFPKLLTCIEESAFSGCASLTNIKFPVSLSIIGKKAFAYCNGFETITVPKTVNIIGEGVFAYCSNLKIAIISDGVKNIGTNVFEDCISLEYLTLPYAGHSLDSINSEDSECSLSRLFRTNYVTSDKTYLSYGSYFVPNSLKTITITGGTRIPSYAFYGFDNLRAIFVNPEVQFAKDSFGHNENCIIAGYADSTAQAYADANKIEFQLISMITSEPKNIESEAGKKVVFTVDAIGNELNYQWQWYNPKTNEWQNSSFDGNKSEKLSVEATTARNGYKYRCIITDSYGNEMISDCVTLSIVSPTSSATLVGDANCDGKVSIADSTAILQSLGNPDKYKLSEQGAVNADVDGNKGITISDSIVIKYYDFKIITELPVKA